LNEHNVNHFSAKGGCYNGFSGREPFILLMDEDVLHTLLIVLLKQKYVNSLFVFFYLQEAAEGEKAVGVANGFK
jgi:hypothetical protein